MRMFRRIAVVLAAMALSGCASFDDDSVRSLTEAEIEVLGQTRARLAANQSNVNGSLDLFTRDTVGRRKDDPANACKDAEKAMVDNTGNVSLKADAIIAPHHGANNGSASCFIEAVDPEFVVFSAGHKYKHPSDAAAQRYLAHGVEQSKMFRADLGDAEGGFEWPAGSISGCIDPVGDDDVDIWLLDDGDVVVEYRDQQSGQDC